jgi:hypothetical protein
MRRDTFEIVLGNFNTTRPFQAFTVELLNGVRLTAFHPEAIILDRDVVVYIERDLTEQYFDASSVVRVVDLVVPPGAE